MEQFQPKPQEIVEILEDAIAEWKLSHEQLARILGCSKESVENWLRKKCCPRTHALRAIELLRDHLQSGNPFPPNLAPSTRGRNAATTLLTTPSGLPSDSPFATEAATAARQFFEAIAMKQFNVAWKCLTRAFQDRRWPNGMKEFTAGYDAFIGLSNLIVAPLNPIVPPACRVFVYYEDMTNIIELPGFGKWSAAQLGQIEDCSKAVVKVRNAILKHGAAKQSVEQVLVSGLFTEQAGNILHDASKMSPERFSEAIGLSSTQQCLLSVPLIAKVLRVNKGRFLIDQLLPVHWGKRVSGRT